MTNITLDGDALLAISVFEKVTRTMVKDFIDTPDKLVFIVTQGQIGAAIGKKGENVKRLCEMFKKNYTSRICIR